MRKSFRSLCAILVLSVMVFSSVAVPALEPVPSGTLDDSAFRMPGAANAVNTAPAILPTEQGAQASGARDNEGASGSRATASIIYAILTPAAFKDALVPLKEWKTKKGMNAEIYTLENMLAAYTGNPAAPDFARVHQFLRKLYADNPELQWVLIVGDGDVDGETFPVPYIFTNASHDPVMGDDTILDYVPSDVMYSGLQKDWDANGNGWYGEPGEEDWTPEAYVGRWPVKNLAEVTGNVNKVLTYEKNPPAGDWLKTAVFAGGLYDVPNIVNANPDEWKTGQFEWKHDNGRTPVMDAAAVMPSSMIKTFLLDYNETYGGNYNPANDTLDQASFIAAMNAGATIVNTASHGWISGNGPTNYIGNGSDPNVYVWQNYHEYYFWSDAQAATNGGRLPLMYSSACDIANFTTVTHPSVGANRDHTLEQLLKNSNGGAIGYISTTNGDYWNPTDGNWWLEVTFWKYMFNQTFRPGEALYKTKVAYDAYLKSRGTNLDLARIRQNKAVYTLLGDPEVPIWTDTPKTLTAEYTGQLYTIPQNFNVTIKDSATSAPIRNALVALTAPGTFARGWTDTSGKVSIPVDTADPGTINITVTAHNFLPYETTTTVTLAPADLELKDTDLSDTTLGKIVRNGEQVTVNAKVRNIGRLDASNVLVKFYDGDPAAGGTEIGAATAPLVQERGNATVSMVWTATSGDHKVFVKADPANTVTEFNENNNVAFITIKVTGVDLTIGPGDISVTPSRLFGGMPSAANGSVLNITATVHNLGAGVAANVYVRFYDGDPNTTGKIIEGDKRIETIPGGFAGNASVSWNQTTSGLHAIFAVVDPRDFFVEYDETNNGANVTVQITDMPRFARPVDPIFLDEDRAMNAALDLSTFVEDPDTPLSSLEFSMVNSTREEANVTVTKEGMVSVRPFSDWNGVTTVTVSVTDGISEVQTKFNVSIKPVWDTPVLDPIPDAELLEGRYFIYNVTARDVDFGDEPTFTDDSPIFNINSTNGRIAFTPRRQDVGKQSARITVTDKGGLTAIVSWKFNITRLNGAPAILLNADTVILGMEGKPITFKFNATDPDNDPLVFSDDCPLFDINPATGVINFTVAKDFAGTYYFNITVKDNGNLSDRRMAKLIIQPAPVVIGGKTEMPAWLFPLLAVVVIVAVGAIVGLALSRKKAADTAARAQKDRYKSIYGQETASSVAAHKCPHCGSYKIQVFEDGGAICNQCGKAIK